MKTLDKAVCQCNKLKAARGQRGFLSVGLGLLLTALFGSTSAIMTATQETEAINRGSALQENNVRTVQNLSH